MTELQIDCLVADALTAMELKKITVEQFDNRVKRLNRMRGIKHETLRVNTELSEPIRVIG